MIKLMNNKNKTVDKYLELIRNAKFTEQEIISFRRLINGSSKLDRDLKQDLVFAFIIVAESKGIRLTKQQCDKGIAYLRNKTYKLNGQLRKTQILGEFERSVINAYKTFTCVGLYNLSDNNYDQYVPIYRCIARSGRAFDYVCTMWGNIVVIAVHESTGEATYSNNPDFPNARKLRPLLKVVA